MELAWLGLTELKALLDCGQLSSFELTNSLLDRIERAEPQLHSFVAVYADEARALARAADAARTARLPRSPLHGLPVVLKDLLDIEGRVCTLGSALCWIRTMLKGCWSCKVIRCSNLAGQGNLFPSSVHLRRGRSR